jgi:hypothetical protein
LQSEKAAARLADVSPSGQGKGADEFAGQYCPASHSLEDLVPPAHLAYVSICQHTSAYVSIRQHTYASDGLEICRSMELGTAGTHLLGCVGNAISAYSTTYNI